MRILLVVFLLLFTTNFLIAQSINYNDVAVIVNMNDSVSIEIGNYFKQQRNIPEQNMIVVDAPASEQISFQEFQDVRKQIEDTLIGRNIQNSINYLVTTKGVPLGVTHTPLTYYAGVPYNHNFASFDSELTLILSHLKDSIGRDFAANNPYFGTREYFSRNLYGIYLVTRLTAYTLEEVKSLIDRSGPNVPVNRDSALFVLDIDPVWDTIHNAIYVEMNQRITAARNMLSTRGWNNYYNHDTVYVTGKKHVLGYVSWGSNDNFHSHYSSRARPNFTWANGAIAETYVSTSARTFEEGLNYGYQSLIADLIREGATGAKGYVYEPFMVALANVSMLFNYYTDTTVTRSFNLAESYYMSFRFLSWMNVVVGDPKTSLQLRNNVSVAEINKEKLHFTVYPNPASSKININCSSCKYPLDVQISDLQGKTLLSSTIIEPELEISSLPDGIYLIRLTSGNNTPVGKILIRKP